MKNPGLDFENLLEYKTSIPERLLLAAILSRAIADAVRGEDRRAALLWLWSKEEHVPFEAGRTGFTFLEICEALDLDSDNIRSDVKEMMLSTDMEKLAWITNAIQRINQPTQTVA